MQLGARAKTEVFHLFFLRQFNNAIDNDLYAIKGGCNLRFFFNSARYSQDLDLDIATLQVQTLANKVDKLLASPNLTKPLKHFGIQAVDFSAPKQTSTTQRWKVQLHNNGGGLPINTKIEFSRRDRVTFHQLDNVSMSICQQYQLPPLRLSHYGFQQSLIQKITALAERATPQARDIFDIYHLLHLNKSKISDTLTSNQITQAQEAILAINFEDYKSQVVNFLDVTQQSFYDDPHYWSEMQERVFNYLDEAML